MELIVKFDAITWPVVGERFFGKMLKFLILRSRDISAQKKLLIAELY
jgi:hypothetical protein